MSAAKILLTEIERLHSILGAALKDLSAEQLNWQPQPDANSMGFAFWHVLRAWDDYSQVMGAGPQLYEKDGWPKRFGFETKGRGIEGSGMGTGFTAADVAVVQVAPEPLRAYLDALRTRTQEYVRSADDQTLFREFKIAWWPNRIATPAYVLGHVMAHAYMHIGEAQSIKSLLPR